jgi:hypothetical protein
MRIVLAAQNNCQLAHAFTLLTCIQAHRWQSQGTSTMQLTGVLVARL